MRYSNFFIVPESELDEKFIEDEMSFLIEKSIHKRNEFKDKNEYADVIKTHYANWMQRAISVEYRR